MGQYTMLLQSIGFLILILLLAYLALRYGLRSVYRGMGGGGYLKVLERVPLDYKSGSSLVLVQMGREVFLIGATQGAVAVLARFNWKDLQELSEEEAVGPAGLKESFSRILQGIRRGRGDFEGEGDRENR